MPTYEGSAVAVILAIFTVAGCAKGSVKLGEQDKFGKVRSAVWFEWTHNQGGEKAVSHSFVMANRRGLCTTTQEAMAEVAGARDDPYESGLTDDRRSYGSTGYPPPTYETYDSGYFGFGEVEIDTSVCKVHRDYFVRLATAFDPIMRGGINTLTLILRDPDDDAEDAPPSAEYKAGNGGDAPYFTSELAYYEENPYWAFVSKFNCDTGTWYRWELGYDEDFFTTVGGKLVAAVDDDVYKITMDGYLDNSNGYNAGDIEMKGKFQKCEVVLEGYDYLFDMEPESTSTTSEYY